MIIENPKKKKKKKLSPKSFENFKIDTANTFKDTNIDAIVDNKSQNIVIKVRTESFEKD